MLVSGCQSLFLVVFIGYDVPEHKRNKVQQAAAGLGPGPGVYAHRMY